MQKHNDAMKSSGHRSLEKYTSHFIGRVVSEMELETEQNCNILTPTLMAITTFLSHSPGLLNRGPGSPASLGHGPHSSIFSLTDLNSNWLIRGPWGPPLLGAGSLYSISSPTDLNSNCSIGGPEGLLCWVLFLSTASYLQLIELPVHRVI